MQTPNSPKNNQQIVSHPPITSHKQLLQQPCRSAPQTYARTTTSIHATTTFHTTTVPGWVPRPIPHGVYTRLGQARAAKIPPAGWDRPSVRDVTNRSCFTTLIQTLRVLGACFGLEARSSGVCVCDHPSIAAHVPTMTTVPTTKVFLQRIELYYYYYDDCDYCGRDC